MCLKNALSWGGGSYVYFSMINVALMHFDIKFSLIPSKIRREIRYLIPIAGAPITAVSCYVIIQS